MDLPHPSSVSNEALESIRAHWLSAITHDLRNPVVAVRGYARLLLEEHAGPLTATQRGYLNNVVENVDVLVELITNLSDFPTPQMLDLRPVHLRDILKDAVQQVNKLPGMASIQLIDESSQDALSTIADPHQLAEALHILVRAMFTLAVPAGSLRVHSSENDAKIAVWLTTKAIPATLHDQEEMDRDLSKSFKILRLHGGSIFERRNDQGYTVIFELPAIRSLECKEVSDVGGTTA